MAVFTEVPFDQAKALVARLGCGELHSLNGITAGIENTNYFAACERGEFVLTIFERLRHDQLPFYLRLMKHLAARGIPVPDPQADATGELLHTLAAKPAAVVTKLAGQAVHAPTVSQCEQVAAMLARMHLASRDFPLHQPNLRGLDWWIETVPLVTPFLTDSQRELLDRELAFQIELSQTRQYLSLPRGPVHADLFRDNVMFDRDRLTGFFDFYFAGVDPWLFDLAVCLNDWCVDLTTGSGIDERATTFVAAYETVRPLTDAERPLLPALLRAAALRFWLSRLWDLHLPRNASLLEPHDPEHFERILRHRIST